MRYLIQLIVMAGDLALIAGASYLFWLGSPCAWVSVPAFLVWHKQGGFMAWNPTYSRRFLANAKRLGL